MQDNLAFFCQRARLDRYHYFVKRKIGEHYLNERTKRIAVFLDARLWRICRLKSIRRRNVQACVYSGRKKCHGLKLQGLYMPDGMCADMPNLCAGRHTDDWLLRESELHLRWQEAQHDAGRAVADYLKIYTDRGYNEMPLVHVAYKRKPGRHLLAWQRLENEL